MSTYFDTSIITRWYVPEPNSAAAKALRARSLGARSLDILHVAAALELGCRDLVTGDRRQAALATAAGLRVTRL